MGSWGLILFGIGLIIKGKKKEAIFYSWLAGIFAFLVIFAGGNVRHDYYQVLAVPVIFKMFFASIYFNNKYLMWFHEKISEMLTISVRNLSDCAFMLKLIFSGILYFFYTTGVLYLCFWSFGIEVELPVMALFYIVLKLSNQIIITPGNLGVRELAYGILSEQVQIGMAEGIMIAVVLRVLNTLVIATLVSLFSCFDLLLSRKKRMVI